MFEKAINDILIADTVLCAYVSTFGSGSTPAIFSEIAPEAAVFPYIVHRISYWSNLDPVVHRFSLVLDYYDYNISRTNSRAAAFRLQFLLDRRKFDSDRYGSIRLFLFNGGPVVEDDPRAIHYNLEFDARGGRKAWGEHNITTTGE